MPFVVRFCLCIAASVFAVASARAGTILGPYSPLFKGIDRAQGTNTSSGGGMPDLQVINVFRVDLTDPDIKLVTTPRIDNWSAGTAETAALKVGGFLSSQGVQLAINANDYEYQGGLPPNGLPDGAVVNVTGILMSQGVITSPQLQGDEFQCAMFFTSNNLVSYNLTNWPPYPTDGFYTAVCGTYPIVVNGVNVGYNYVSLPQSIHGVQPRTLYGTSQDKRYLYLAVIDGRQSSYSEGALDWESAQWMIMAGAYTAMNMDGGGSATVDMADSTGKPIMLNYPSYYAQYHAERSVGAHLGVYAKPIAGFINDVVPSVDNTAASVSWSTAMPSSTQIRYGTTTNFSSSTTRQTTLVTSHYALLTNLLPNTGYYYQIMAQSNGVAYNSANLFFVTSNYVTTNAIFPITQVWNYNSTDLDGINWKTNTYNDSAWLSGSGTLWVDVRGANANIPFLATQMPGDDNNFGYPFHTYYFRTYFSFTNQLTGVSLILSAYVDDGAVFYLNGREVYRLRMTAAPATISNSTLAIGFSGTGDATSPGVIELTGSVMTNLVAGNNLLAVEVHNYSAGSPDITFGMSLDATPQYDIPPQISVTPSNNVSILNWDRGGFTLCGSSSVAGPWTAVTGPCGNVCVSPWAVTNSGTARFYRLQR